MKKLHKKIIHLQAAALVRHVKEIKSITRGRKLSKKSWDGNEACWFFYPRIIRREIRAYHGKQYQPHLLVGLVQGITNGKKAKLYRGLLSVEQVRLGVPIYGNYGSCKKFLCEQLIPIRGDLKKVS